jgi:hypothetical protein
MPEWPKGAVCKIAGEAYGGSNPPPPTDRQTDRQTYLHTQEWSHQTPSTLSKSDLLLTLADSSAQGHTRPGSDLTGDAVVESVIGGQPRRGVGS